MSCKQRGCNSYLTTERNEGIDLTHNPEFTTLEFYMGIFPAP